MPREFFPVKLILNPAGTFAAMAEGKTGWLWPLGIYTLSAAVSSALLGYIPPEFTQAAFQGASLPAGRGMLFCFAVAFPGGLAFTAFACALMTAFAPFLKGGRLILRLPAAAACVGAIAMAAALRRGDPAFALPAALAAAAAAWFSVWAAMRRAGIFSALLKAALAVSLIALAGEVAGGAAALAGWKGAYEFAEYFFSFMSLVWIVKACSACTGATVPKSFVAAVLAVLGAAGLCFLLFSLGLITEDVFQTLLFF